jgi:ubiquinone/menaquinone biosynthesis C-methylase UbiE
MDLIACPKCKGNVTKRGKFLKCSNCFSSYQFRNGIPILLDESLSSDYFKEQEEIFDEYSTKEATFIKWMESYIDRLLTNLKPRKKDVIMDIATGDGYIAIELAKRGHSVIAFDLSMGMLLKLKKTIEKMKLTKNVIFVCGNAVSLPFKKGIADIITANAIMEHIPDEKRAISEIDRVSRKNARFMVTTPLAYKYLWPVFIPVNYIHDKRIGHLRRYTFESFKKKFKNWKAINVYYTGHFMKVTLFLIAYVFKLGSRLDEIAERSDEGKLNSPYGASNITVFFQKK